MNSRKRVTSTMSFARKRIVWESMRSTFGLSDNQMDVAMKTAAQFPAVELGGHAPS